MWKLHIGIHRGTITSRDLETNTGKYDDSTSPLESLEDCIDTAQKWQDNYRSMGYVVYVADAIAPDGTKHSDIIPVVSAPR